MARVFISYQRDVTPDQDLAQALYKALKSTHEVFLDTSMLVGEKWVEHIHAELHQADCLIALLSPFSVNSEMTLRELELAYQLQARRGRPLLLPIRVAYHERLPPPLSGYLQSINCSLWEGPEDTPGLLEQLDRAMGMGAYQPTSAKVPFHGGNLHQVVVRGLHEAPAERYANVAKPAGARQAAANVYDRGRSSTTHAAPSALPSPGREAVPAAPKVFICCRVDAQEDLEVAMSFYEGVATAGANPFLAPKNIADRENWIRAVSRALRECDAFLLLLSRQAAVSEMVAAELEMARQLSGLNAGRPHILPVRVGLPEGDSYGLPLLEQVQEQEQAAWSGPSDTPGIVARLLERMGHRVRGSISRNESPDAPSRSPALPLPARPSIELPGGVVSSKSPYYVVRPSIEEACRREVVKPGALIRIKAPRQMGKTSLMMGISEHAARAGMRIATLNLQMADGASLANQDRLLRWLCAVATRKLKLPVQKLDEQWDDVFGPKDNCTAYFEDHLLAQDEPLVLALDHVDRVFEAPETAEEFLALLRAWHEMGKSQEPWSKLRLVLGYSTEMYLPLQINHSPFNVGLPVVLSEWDADTVHDLARRHGLSWSRAEVEWVMGLLGGHPHLIRLALYHVANGMSLTSVLATAATDEGLFADHLKYLLWHVQGRPELREATGRVMAAAEPVRLSTELAFKLVSLGLVHLHGNAVLPARDLYRRYFLSHLSMT